MCAAILYADSSSSASICTLATGKGIFRAGRTELIHRSLLSIQKDERERVRRVRRLQRQLWVWGRTSTAGICSAAKSGQNCITLSLLKIASPLEGWRRESWGSLKGDHSVLLSNAISNSSNIPSISRFYRVDPEVTFSLSCTLTFSLRATAFDVTSITFFLTFSCDQE